MHLIGRHVHANAQNWFAPAFEMMDRAVFRGERILIHCAEGKSRSAALVIAYLMNRFKVTHEEAERFVRSKRPSMDTKFSEELAHYGNILRPTSLSDQERIWPEETITSAEDKIREELEAQSTRRAS